MIARPRSRPGAHNQKMTVAALHIAYEDVGALVVSGCDASPVLQPAELALDAIALFQERI